MPAGAQALRFLAATNEVRITIVRQAVIPDDMRTLIGAKQVPASQVGSKDQVEFDHLLVPSRSYYSESSGFCFVEESEDAGLWAPPVLFPGSQLEAP